MHTEEIITAAHDGDFGRFGGDHHCPFGKTVGEEAGVAGEEDIGQREERGSQGYVVVLLFPAQQVHGKTDQQQLEEIVVESTQKLRGQEGPKADALEDSQVRC